MEISKSYAWSAFPKKRRNSPLLPSNIRGLLIGKSNCGKTTLMLNLLLQPNWLDYDHLFVFGKSLHQHEYYIMKKGLENGLTKEQLSNLFDSQDTTIDYDPLEIIDVYIKNGGKADGKIKQDFYTDCSKIPDPTQLNESEQNLLILDDCLLEKQNKAESYYTRERHNNCDTFYISQNYFRLPRHTIRENENFICLFQQDAKNVNHIHADHCTDISIKEFRQFCKQVWEKPYHFITIDLSSTKFNGKYRENLDNFYIPTT